MSMLPPPGFIWYIEIEVRLKQYLKLALQPDQYHESGVVHDDAWGVECERFYFTDEARQGLVEAYARHGTDLGISTDGPHILWIHTAGFGVVRYRGKFR